METPKFGAAVGLQLIKASGVKCLMMTPYQVLKPLNQLLQKQLSGGTNLKTSESNPALPEWCVYIVRQLQKTIFKRIIDLDSKQTVDWCKYGKMIGVIDRYESWLTFNVPEAIKREGWDKLSPLQERKIESLFTDIELRADMEKRLGRKIKAGEHPDDLANESLAKQAESFRTIKQDAEKKASAQKPKNLSKFLKGRAEGYELFLDEDGQFAGDRGRTNLYFDMLALREEIEKLAAVKPRMTRSGLQKWLLTEGKVKMSNDREWFDHFCDEIHLFKKR